MSKKTKAKKKRVEKKQRERSLPGTTAGRKEGRPAAALAAANGAPTVDRKATAAEPRGAESGAAVAIRPLAHRGLAQLCQFLREHSGTARISSSATKNV